MDMKSFKQRLLWIVLLLSSGYLMGCSVDGQITDGTVKVYNPSMAHLSGFISGSYQNVVTASGYKVSASFGSPYSEPVENKTNGGYTVYSSLQGNINSETYEIVRQ